MSGELVDAGGAGDWITAALLDGLNPTCWRNEQIETATVDRAIERALDFAAACCRHLRGFLGTEDWTRIARDPRTASRNQLQIEPVEIAAGGGCELSFRNPNGN
jgi:hypothetical protein